MYETHRFVNNFLIQVANCLNRIAEAMVDWNHIAQHIGSASGESFSPRQPDTVGGGCINAGFRLADHKRSFFVKTNQASLLGMFEAEAAGLDLIDSTGTVRVPHPLCSGISGGQAYLVMEHIALEGHGSSETAGRRLAAMHRHRADRFGWERDNTIGSTPQPNTPSDDWIEFWRGQRLGFQLRLAARQGHGGRLQNRGRELLERLPSLLDHDPQPSLIHGDLWGGNLAYDNRGNPVIYDPAVYYADREAELAMTELFGRQSNRFYAAYNEAWPLDPGYTTRRDLYNLYHILNHLNLFGGGYGGQALGMIDRLLAEVGY